MSNEIKLEKYTKEELDKDLDSVMNTFDFGLSPFCGGDYWQGKYMENEKLSQLYSEVSDAVSKMLVEINKINLEEGDE